MSVATRNPKLTELMEQPGPNPIKDAFAPHNPEGFERFYGPGPIEHVKEVLENLLKDAPHTLSQAIYFNQGSEELKMLAELLVLNRSTIRQLAKAMEQQPVLEVDIKNMRHKITFRRPEP